MKVLMINGSPHPKGNTAAALSEMEKVFEAEGLEYAYAIAESPVNISCKVKSVTELGSHDMFIAEVVAVRADSYLLDDNGRLCLDKAKLVAYNHGEYFLLGEKLGFYQYASSLVVS